MKKILLDSNKNFYKGNMHCHSNLSDGKLSPEELKEQYKSHGYSFLAITDHEHFNNNSYLDDEDFITITSAEYAVKEFPEQSTLKNFKMKVAHLNLYAKKQDNTNHICYSPIFDHDSTGERRERILKEYDHGYERVYTPEGINEIIKIANENGFFVAYNHPRWSLENYSHYSKYEGLWGVEILNYACHSSGIYEYDINVHDDFLRDGKRIFASAGDDNHSLGNQFGAWVVVNAESLTYDNIINALLNGDFYASSGPEIKELYVEDNKIYVKSSNAKMISFSTEGRRHGSKKAEPGSYVNEAEFEIREEDGYVRICVLDEYGNRADSQAYFVE